MNFLYLLKANRPDFMMTMTAEEMATMGRHTEWMTRHHAAGRVLLAGPCLDGSFALNVFEAESPEAAQQFADSDPAVAEGIATVEVHPIHVGFFKGEPPKMMTR